MLRPVLSLILILLTACAPQVAPLPSQTPANAPTLPPTATTSLLTTAEPTATINITPLATNAMREALESALNWQCPSNFAGQTLRVHNWSTYVAETTIQHFELLCDVTVEYTEFDSEDDMLANIHANINAYDIIVPSNITVPMLVQENLLMPLNLENIPNFANISETLSNPLYDAGNRYSVPYQWGTIGIGYDIERTREQIVSWQQLFDYTGRVAWLNENRAMMGVALLLMGYSPSTSDPQEIAYARDYLIARSLNVTIVADDSVGQDLLASGEVDMVVEYSGDIFQLIADCGCDTVHYTIPREGTMLWVDNLVMTAGVQNQALAEAFIDYILEPQVGADISNFTAYASPNQVAINMGLIDESLLTNVAIYPEVATEERLFLVQRNPAVEALYNEAWQAVLDAIQNRTPEAG